MPYSMSVSPRLVKVRPFTLPLLQLMCHHFHPRANRSMGSMRVCARAVSPAQITCADTQRVRAMLSAYLLSWSGCGNVPRIHLPPPPGLVCSVSLSLPRSPLPHPTWSAPWPSRSRALMVTGRASVRDGWLPPSRHYATLVFGAACFEIMKAWFYHPASLPREYVGWISAMADLDMRLVRALRLLRSGEVEMGKHYDGDFLQSYVGDFGLDPAVGDPANGRIDCCAWHHPHTCTGNITFRLSNAVRATMPLYLYNDFDISLTHLPCSLPPSAATASLCRGPRTLTRRCLVPIGVLLALLCPNRGLLQGGTPAAAGAAPPHPAPGPAHHRY